MEYSSNTKENLNFFIVLAVADTKPVDDKIPSPSTGSVKCITSWACGDNADKLLFVQQYSVFFLVLYFSKHFKFLMILQAAAAY